MALEVDRTYRAIVVIESIGYCIVTRVVAVVVVCTIVPITENTESVRLRTVDEKDQYLGSKVFIPRGPTSVSSTTFNAFNALSLSNNSGATHMATRKLGRS